MTTITVRRRRLAQYLVAAVWLCALLLLLWAAGLVAGDLLPAVLTCTFATQAVFLFSARSPFATVVLHPDRLEFTLPGNDMIALPWSGYYV